MFSSPKPTTLTSSTTHLYKVKVNQSTVLCHVPKSVVAKVDHLVDENVICLGTDTVVTSIAVDKNVASVVVVRNVTSTVAKLNVTSIFADNIIPITADKIVSTKDHKQKFNASHEIGRAHV